LLVREPDRAERRPVTTRAKESGVAVRQHNRLGCDVPLRVVRHLETRVRVLLGDAERLLLEHHEELVAIRVAGSLPRDACDALDPPREVRGGRPGGRELTCGKLDVAQDPRDAGSLRSECRLRNPHASRDPERRSSSDAESPDRVGELSRRVQGEDALLLGEERLVEDPDRSGVPIDRAHDRPGV
jgi:hypothetical protein